MRFINRVIALLLALGMAVSLAGCSKEEMMGSLAGLMEKATGPIQPDKTLDGSAWRNSDIIGAVTETTQVSLKDDFHTAVNRDWMLTADTSEYGRASRFVDAQVALNEQMLSLFQPGDNTCDEEILPQSEADHLKDLLLTMTELGGGHAVRNQQGVEPLRRYVQAVEDIQTLDGLTAYLCGEGGPRLLQETLINGKVDKPLVSRDVYTVHLNAISHLVLDDPEEYRSITSFGERLLEVRRDAVRTVLGWLGYSDAQAGEWLRRCLWLEVSLVRCLPTQSETNNINYATHINNPYTREELEARQGSFPLTTLLDGAGLGGSDSYLLYEPLYLDTLAALYTDSRVEDFKAYFIVHTVLEALPLLDDACGELEETISAVMNGTSQSREQTTGDEEDPLPPVPTDTLPEESDTPLEETVAGYVTPYLSGVAQELYVARFCTAEEKRQLTAMIDDIVACYEEMLAGEDWLGEETRQQAIEKLRAIKARVLYPDELPDYSGLTLLSAAEGGSLLDAVADIRAFETQHAGDKVNRPIDRADWDMTEIPTTAANACYLFNSNVINILAGTLAGNALYDPEAPVEQNMAMLGVIVGHEISHGFDINGYYFDKDGLPNSWWTSEDELAFRERADRLANYYSTLSVLPNMSGGYNGKKVQSEAIADMGGVKAMLLMAEKIPDFDYELFFTSYASLWRSQCDYFSEMQNMDDEHPLDFLRTNVTLQQFEEFYQTFDIGPGDGMYLAPENRVAVW